MPPLDDLRPLTYDRLLELARDAEGVTLRTVTGREFTVGIYRDGLFFTPASSGWGQADGRKAVERFVERFNETRSLRPGHYGDATRNASYLVGLLLWADSGATTHASGNGEPREPPTVLDGREGVSG
jgi:hypothetical protein